MRATYARVFPLFASICLGVAVAADPPAPPPQVAISPPNIELALDAAGASGAVKVHNLGTEPIEVQVSTANWRLDDDSQVEIIAPQEQSLDSWMIINPLRFTVAPKRSQTVRFAVRPRVEPAPGEHRGMIYFDQVLPPAPAKTGIRFRFRYGVAVYGLVEPVHRNTRLHRVAVEDTARGRDLVLDIESVGNANVRPKGDYQVFAAGPGDAATVLESGPLPTRPVLPGTRRMLRQTIGKSLPAGQYRVRLSGAIADQTLDQSLAFEVRPPERTGAGAR
ncbi:MAG: fimbria/pilus periplasmic chaperone [Chromatiales bacterium]|nr:fimbria/pilus periplasmic chaperone [Chromatiales bacterium]